MSKIINILDSYEYDFIIGENLFYKGLINYVFLDRNKIFALQFEYVMETVETFFF